MGEVRVTVRVRPGSSRTRVGGSYGDDPQLVVAVNAPPVDGAANESVIRAVADAVGIRPNRITLVSGQSARSKVLALRVDDPDEPAVRDALQNLLTGGS